MKGSKIRVFHIEDDYWARDSIERVIRSAVDLEYVGWHDRNTSDLADRVQSRGPDVVVVDLALGLGVTPAEMKKLPENNGLAAIRAIRGRLGDAVSILALTNWPDLLNDAVESGADGVLTKDIDGDVLREQIRRLHRGETPLRLDLGNVIGLELHPRLHNNQFAVLGDHGRTRRIPLEPFPFAFLHYLAEERMANRRGFVLFAEGDNAFILTEKALWTRICAQDGADYQQIFSFPKEDYQLTRASCKVNTKAGQLLPEGAPPIIHTPRKRSGSGGFTLSANIISHSVKICLR